MGTHDAIAELERIASVIRAVLPDPDGIKLAKALGAIATGKDPAAALGIVRRPGQRKLSTEAALAERNRLLREWRVRFYPHVRDVAPVAVAIYQVLSRYGATSWRSDHKEGTCPPRLIGDEREYAWQLLKARSYIPKPRTIRRVLATS